MGPVFFCPLLSTASGLSLHKKHVQPINLYEVAQKMRDATEPFTVVFVSVSLQRNEGGERTELHNQLTGPLKKNMNSRYMIGLKDYITGVIRHIYLHSILEVGFRTGEYYNVTLTQ